MLSSAITAHVKEFAESYQMRRLPPHPDASLHLIGYFKESHQYDAGIDFWHWIVKQDSNYIDLRTYGAAIELLALYGQTLAYCEEVYTHGLKRFPESFNEYHLSPGAIVSQRHEPTRIPKTSMTLMQGIIKARLIHGDWRSAYMALDTALRLHPTQIPPHFFHTFLEERPVHEVYQIFCILCQSGSQIRPYDLGWVLSDLVDAQQTGSGSAVDMDLALALLNAIRVFAASDQSVSARHINILLQSFLNLVPTREADNSFSTAGDNLSPLAAVLQINSLFPLLGAVPEISTYNTVIAAAGRTRDKEMLSWAKAALIDSDIVQNEITFECLLNASSRISGASGVESTWISRDPAVDLMPSTWAALAKATSEARNVDFLHSQMKLHHVTDQKHILQAVGAKLAKVKPSQTLSAPREEAPADSKLTVASFSAALQTFDSVLRDPNFHNLKAMPAPSQSIWPTNDIVNEEWQIKLYDEVSIDPTVMAAAEAKTSTENEDLEENPVEATFVSTTGFSLEELRYRNWKGINDLLQQAETFEARIEQSVNRAIEEGAPSRQAKRSTKGLSTKGPRRRLLQYQLTQHLEDTNRMRANPPIETEWRNKILDLRRTKD